MDSITARLSSTQPQCVDVDKILDSYSKGSTKDYDQFLSLLQDPKIQDAELLACLRGLKKSMYRVGQDYEVLIGVILKVDWTEKDLKVFHEYSSFVVNLVSAHPVFVHACLRMLIKHFSPAVKRDETLDEKQRGCHQLTFTRVHAVIQAVTRIMPMVPKVLLPLLEDCFPYIGKDTYLQECYAGNLLQLCAYLPQHRPAILELLLSKMTKLDVRAPRQEIEEADYCSSDEEEMAEGMEQDIFHMDDCSKQNEKSALEQMKHKEADKLDALLNLTFHFIQSVCFNDGILDWDATKKLYKELLFIFEKVILPTHASCHVQFIMFYIVSLKPALCDGFIDYLWKKVQDPNTQSVYRQACVAYLGSLLARAKYTNANTVKACLDLMCSWIHRYISEASELSHADLRYHAAFYSVCQAVFYVFVFRNKELFELPNGYKHMQSWNFQTIVTSRLNPLKICLPIITKTFASVTRMHQLAYCNTVIEHNNRTSLPIEAESAAGPNKLTSFNPLDSYFPFDPYLLKRSKKFITPLYQEFQGSVEEEEENMEDEDDFLPEVLSPSSLQFSKTPVQSPNDFLMYGVSPGFKNI